jgi:predicted RNA-binding protein YlxR (DUF448 family)
MAKNKFLRTCVICKNIKPKKELFRYTIYNNELIIDFYQKLNGRGFYTCKNLECIQGLNENIIRKSLKITEDFKYQPSEIINMVIRNLKKEIFNNLKIGNKSGVLVATLNRFVESVAKNDFNVVFVANDISDNSFKKVKKFLEDKDVIHIFDKEELGEIFNKTEVNIVGIKESEFQDMIMEKIKLLINLLGG